MKIGFKKKKEHSQRVEKPNQDSNSALLGVDPWIDLFFSPPWSSPMEKPRNLCKKMVEQKWKDEEEWRTIERKREKKEGLHNKFCTKWSSKWSSVTN